MQRYAWHLTCELVLFSIADGDVEDEEKNKILFELMKYTVPEEFCMGKQDLLVITSLTELCDLIRPYSWLLLKVLGTSSDTWIKGEVGESIHVLKTLVENIRCNNNCAERNIRLMKDFVCGYRS